MQPLRVQVHLLPASSPAGLWDDPGLPQPLSGFLPQQCAGWSDFVKM